ncbi:outer membrane protein assembly factor BamB family protein [Haloferax prahovense]|uniref:outer membrane protein assembly factor BamB family protein n=1 Tax=Haloferax prahovense TaxID=381852 RepID=UPI0006785E07|nr:PQQ-binding-like beta-propeller repeat protein [Haloferax prahovense]
MFEDHSRRTFLSTLGALTASGVAGTALADSHSATDDGTTTAGWSQFRAGPERTGTVAGEAAPDGPEVTESWVANTGATLIGESVDVDESIVAHGTVYRPYLREGTTSEAGVTAFDAETGDERWDGPEESHIGRVATEPVVHDGRLYLISETHHSSNWETELTGLHALDTETGEVVWETTHTDWEWSPDELWTGPLLAADGTVYVSHVTNASAGGQASTTIEAVDPETGDVRWRTAAAYRVNVAAYSDGVLYGVETNLDAANELVAWDTTDGSELWSAPLDGGGTELDMAVEGDTIYRTPDDYYYDGPNRVYAHDTADGSVRWQTTLSREYEPTYLSAPAVADGTVYVTTARIDASVEDDGLLSTVYGLDATSGDVLWSQNVATELRGDPSVAGDTVYVGGNALPANEDDPAYRYPAVHAFSGTDGAEKWSYLVRKTDDLGTYPYEVISAETPTVADGKVYVNRRTQDEYPYQYDEFPDGMVALEASDTAPDDANQPRTVDGPIARILPDPLEADNRDFDSGVTVHLDGSVSTGDIETYEWQFGDGAQFSETGATTEVTLDFCGTLDVTLRVTGPDGNQSTVSISLSTER